MSESFFTINLAIIPSLLLNDLFSLFHNPGLYPDKKPKTVESYVDLNARLWFGFVFAFASFPMEPLGTQDHKDRTCCNRFF